jgi:radical SAM superfamily enzyme YgiQ (UPF0313 family)
MRYQGNVFRPPSEANSLILQVTLGCSYNECTFCAMYRDKEFRVRPIEEVEEDLRLARAVFGDGVRRVFLADGDALILGTRRLREILDRLHRALPRLQRVGIYATPQSLLRKTVEELEELRDRKLTTLYLGVESGSAEVLRRLRKGVTPDQMIEAGRRAVEAGMKLSTMIILGAGGRELAEEHARESARVLNAIRPRFVSTLAMMVVPEAPLHEEMVSGRFEPPDPRGTLEELRLFVAGLETDGAIFRSNHASNYLALAGTLMKDKEALLATLDRALEGPVPAEFPYQGF